MSDLRQFLAEQGLTQASIARSIGVSAGALNQYLKGTYKGDVAGLDNKVQTFIANYQHKSSEAAQITLTGDLTMIHFTCDEAMVNQEMGVVYGKAGTGKTVAIKAFVAKHPEAVLIETIPMMSVKSLLCKILEGLGTKNAQGNVEQLLDQAVALFKKSERVLLIDEAENLTTKSLEAIRRLHDFSLVPVILIGTYALMQNLKGRNGELLQLYSRISNKWEMKGLNDEDRTALFGELGKHIKRYTDDIRRSVSIFKKAKRLGQLAGEALSPQHIAMATQSVILD